MNGTGNPTVVLLPAVKVRYGYNTPSMSRRGGTRLHPIKDGTAPMGEQLMGLRFRDKSGQKLRDTVNPRTGFCTGVTSPLEGEVSGKGTSGSHNAQTRRAAVTKVHVPKKNCSVYVDDEGFTIRTTDMGDNLRPVGYVKPPTKPVKEPRVGKTTGGNRRRVAPDTVPGATGANGRITRDDCLAYIKAMAKGRNVNITDALIADARKVLTSKRKAAQKALGGK